MTALCSPALHVLKLGLFFNVVTSYHTVVTSCTRATTTKSESCETPSAVIIIWEVWVGDQNLHWHGTTGTLLVHMRGSVWPQEEEKSRKNVGCWWGQVYLVSRQEIQRVSITLVRCMLGIDTSSQREAKIWSGGSSRWWSGGTSNKIGQLCFDFVVGISCCILFLILPWFGAVWWSFSVDS